METNEVASLHCQQRCHILAIWREPAGDHVLPMYSSLIVELDDVEVAHLPHKTCISTERSKQPPYHPKAKLADELLLDQLLGNPRLACVMMGFVAVVPSVGVDDGHLGDCRVT